MRPRVATHTVRLEPSVTVELLSLARQHDEKLKDLRQDIFRAETKLSHQLLWRWPFRFAFFVAGIIAVLAWQNESIRSGVASFFSTAISRLRPGGVETLVMLLVASVVAIALLVIAYRLIRWWTPEARARKLMRQFAKQDGVAAYVFTDEDTTEGEASLVNALLRPGKTKIRQRRLTDDHRSLVSAMTHFLNQNLDRAEPARSPSPELDTDSADTTASGVRPIARSDIA